MRKLVPVYPVFLSVPLLAAEVEMQVQHIKTVVLCLGRAIEIGFYHFASQKVGQVLLVLWEEACGDPLAHRHGRVPQHEARLGHHLV